MIKELSLCILGGAVGAIAVETGWPAASCAQSRIERYGTDLYRVPGYGTLGVDRYRGESTHQKRRNRGFNPSWWGSKTFSNRRRMQSRSGGDPHYWDGY